MTMITTTIRGTTDATTPVNMRNRSGTRPAGGITTVLSTAVTTCALDGLGGRGRPAFAVKAVPDAPDGHDLERGHPGELLAQPADVHIYCLRVARELVAPDVFEQHVAAVDATGERQQVRQEVELAGRELDVAAVEEHPPRRAVQRELIDRVALRDRPGIVRLWRGSAQYRVDAGEHLADRERLCDVVVRAQLKANDLVNLGVLGRDHDDRHAAGLAQSSAEIETAHAGKHQVEQAQVWARRARRAQAGRAVACFLHRESGRRELVLQHFADALVVLDHQPPSGTAVAGRAAHPSSTTWPVSRNTMSSATLVTRSEMRSMLCATSSSVTARRAPSVSVLPVPISFTRSSNTRCQRRSTSLSRLATSRARGTSWSMIASRMS